MRKLSSIPHFIYKKWLKKIFIWSFAKIEINYIYFSLFLLFISFLSLLQLLSFDGPLFGLPLFFFLYGALQALLIVWVFICLAYVLRRWAPRWLFLIFVSLSFIFLLLYFTRFQLSRIMDASILYFFKFFFGCDLDHFFAAFQALNLNPTMIAITFFSILFVPFVGILLYLVTHKLSRRWPWGVSFSQIVMVFGILGSVLFILDMVAVPYLNRHLYSRFQKKLPLGTTFLTPAPNCLELNAPLLPPREEKVVVKSLPLLSANKKPNIYFFVIETLRGDFVTDSIAPHLTAFGKENLSFSEGYSNANSTHLSWFALFHANFPYNWAEVRRKWKKGSAMLQLFKRIGYKIKVFTSAELRYYNMDRVLFGENRYLVDEIVDSSKLGVQTWQRDLATLQEFEKSLSSSEDHEGHLFLFFLDTTHSEYSFPETMAPFQPIVKQIDYLALNPKELEPIKNRYRNAVHYVDHLIGNFLTFLKEKDLYSEAIIAITGDHGEEFLEEGAFFHGTHLNEAQLKVPIFLKIPKPIATSQATHIELFPTILHYITGSNEFSPLFDGKSLYLEKKWPYRLSVLQNGPDTPCEFSIEKQNFKLHLRFLDTRDIYHQTKLEILEKTTCDVSSFSQEEVFSPLNGK